MPNSAAIETIPPAASRIGREGGLTSARQPRASAVGGKAITLYLREIGRVEPLRASEVRALALRAQKGDTQAREQLLKASLPLVVQIAREYENIGLSLLELVSEGNLGLMQALNRFDPQGEREFSVHASWWIKQSIKRALAQAPKA